MTTTLSIAIGTIVDFACRRGDLVTSGPPGVTQREGIIAHQRLQSLRKTDAGYSAEYTLDTIVDLGAVSVLLRGRADGVWAAQARIEEIKTISGDAARVPPATQALHFAQACFYGFCFCEQTQQPAATLQVTYVDPRGNVSATHTREMTHAALREFVYAALDQYLAWCEFTRQHIAARDAALAATRWPFGEFRTQQRTIAENVYKNIHQKRQLLCEAPTGTGKTMAHLFPALKALAGGFTQRLLWLTSKTSGQRAVLDAVAQLQGDTAPLPLRVLQLTAKDKLCFCKQGAGTDGDVCPYAIGYYDRLPAARLAACNAGVLDAANLLRLAQQFSLCPFEFSLDLVPHMDVVVADVNYVFDPLVGLTALNGDSAAHTALLIDEAHNLIERSRLMYSAGLSSHDVISLITQIKPLSRKTATRLQRLLAHLRSDAALTIAALGEVLEQMLLACGELAAQVVLPSAVSEAAYPLLRARVICELAAEQHRLLVQQAPDGSVWQVTCVDPAQRNAAMLAAFASATLFSATLVPAHYCIDQLGLAADTPLLRVASPFAAEHLLVAVCPFIDTRFRERARSIDELAQLVSRVVGSRPGNYFCALPSYRYLDDLLAALGDLDGVSILAQTPAWRDADRDNALAQLKCGQVPTLLLGICGGSFGESIDLPGESLIGVIVVGVGLQAPDAISTARRAYFDAHGRDGYALTYQYPGWQRVIQTAGRLIRSSADRGVLVLVDPRFVRNDYRALWPPHWQLQRFASTPACIEAVQAFWRLRE